MSWKQNLYFPLCDLDPVTLILKPDPDVVNMYHHIKNEVSMSTTAKVVVQTDTHT